MKLRNVFCTSTPDKSSKTVKRIKNWGALPGPAVRGCRFCRARAVPSTTPLWELFNAWDERNSCGNQIYKEFCALGSGRNLSAAHCGYQLVIFLRWCQSPACREQTKAHQLNTEGQSKAIQCRNEPIISTLTTRLAQVLQDSSVRVAALSVGFGFSRSHTHMHGVPHAALQKHIMSRHLHSCSYLRLMKILFFLSQETLTAAPNRSQNLFAMKNKTMELASFCAREGEKKKHEGCNPKHDKLESISASHSHYLLQNLLKSFHTETDSCEKKQSVISASSLEEKST